VKRKKRIPREHRNRRTENELCNALAVYGAVQTVSIIDGRDIDRPRGFAFVEMESDKETPEASCR